MRRLIVCGALAFAAVVCTAGTVEAQRGAPDNPYPQELKAPAVAMSKTARAKFVKDSLRAQYPVSSKNEPCFKYSEPEKVTSGDAYFCYRDRGTALDTALVYGALHTYYRGKWGNVVAVWTNAKTAPASLVFNDGSRVAIAFALDSSKVRH